MGAKPPLGLMVLLLTLLASALISNVSATAGLLVAKLWGGSGNDEGHGVAVDALGNIYVTGTSDSFDQGLTGLTLLKYTSSGNLVWQKLVSAPGSSGVAVDSSGNVYVTGSILSPDGEYDQGLLLKFNPLGGLLWQTAWGGTFDAYGGGLALDSSGNIYTVGSAAFPGTPYGAFNAFLLKFNPSGGLEWETRYGGNRTTHGGGVAVDLAGNVYVTGSVNSPDWSTVDAFLLKFNSSGSLISQNNLEGAGGSSTSQIAVPLLAIST